jgi:hypothetical protein
VKKKGEVANGEQLFGLNEDSVLIYNDAKGAKLIAKAHEGDVDADAVLCGLALRHMNLGYAFPPRLGSYIQDVLRQRSCERRHNEGGSKYENFIRNFTISQVATHLRNKHAIKNKKQQRELIRKALEKIGVHISADGIRQILTRMPKSEHKYFIARRTRR